MVDKAVILEQNNSMETKLKNVKIYYSLLLKGLTPTEILILGAVQGYRSKEISAHKRRETVKKATLKQVAEAVGASHGMARKTVSKHRELANSNKAGGYNLPARFARDKNLPSHLKILLAVILWYRENGVCTATNKTIAGDLRTSVRHIQRSINKLCELGYITKTPIRKYGGKGITSREIRVIGTDSGRELEIKMREIGDSMGSF